MSEEEAVENFYGVYLLQCLNPQYRGRAYIGFTVDPSRRIKQHNRGREFGGACRTSKKGPWKMILIVYGFPSEVSALRFEWAWQHPKKSRRLKSLITSKKSSETTVKYNIRVLSVMLSIAPWNRLPLTIRWLSEEAAVHAPSNFQPPSHMPIEYGSLTVKKKKETNSPKYLRGTSETGESGNENEVEQCSICETGIENKDILKCLNSNCDRKWHMFCLADKFLEEESLNGASALECVGEIRKIRVLPVEGSCPGCKSLLLWGDLIRHKISCSGIRTKQDSSDTSFSVDTSFERC